jgi:hypothetical protein
MIARYPKDASHHSEGEKEVVEGVDAASIKRPLGAQQRY